MENVFLAQPEFISADPRRNRPDKKGVGYTVTPEFMFLRHQALLPKRLVEGKTILDLGSCIGASGAWSLSQGAASYTGVELNGTFVRESSALLSKYYRHANWRIEAKSIEDFAASAERTYDLILASGVLAGLGDPVSLLAQISRMTSCVVIESMHQPVYLQFLTQPTKQAMSRDPQLVDCLENAPYISISQQGMIGDGEQTVMFAGFNPSMGALKILFTAFGFEYNDSVNSALKLTIPHLYSPLRRFGALFEKNSRAKRLDFGFAKAVENPENVIETISWEGL